MAQHNDLGKKGEAIARDFLEENDYSILEINWRYKRTEIDLIARINQVLVFIEVKTRTKNYYGDPAGQIDDAQMERIAKAASVYMHMIGHDWEIRFDIIGILIDHPQRAEIKHYKDVWFNGW